MDLDCKNPLGRYLRDRRAKLDPVALGFGSERRRTPGLRREEVAQLSGVSVNWYTWIEQGRGGIPSVETLEGLSNALQLTPAEREHMILLARPPVPRTRDASSYADHDKLRHTLDALTNIPAYTRTLEWDVGAWNKTAARVLPGFTNRLGGRHNILRELFLNPDMQKAIVNWHDQTIFAVGAFRADVARLGHAPSLVCLVDELRSESGVFKSLWEEQEVHHYGVSQKLLRTDEGGMRLNHSAFQPDGQHEIKLIIYLPDSIDDRARLDSLISSG